MLAVARPDRIAHRTLVIGDSHGTLPMIREALRVGQRLGADLVVSVGDAGIWPGSKGKEFLDMWDRMGAERGIDTVICPGNHEDGDALDAAARRPGGLIDLRPTVTAAPRGHTLTLGRWTWRFLGGAASIDGPGGRPPQTRGPLDAEQYISGLTGGRLYPAGHDLGGWWPQERITQADVDTTIAAGPADVLITHDTITSIPLHDCHKPIDPLGWPLGWRQRELISEARDAIRPAVHLAGHWHQHVLHHDRIGITAVLSADVNPDEPQWAIVDDDLEQDAPVLRLVTDWGTRSALTAHGPRGRTSTRHRTANDLGDRDLDDIPWQDPDAYTWPDP